MKRIAVVFIALLLFGALKLPIEKSIDDAHRAAYFRGAKLNLSLREQIGQGAFIAALGGFRGAIADLLCIRATVAWENTQWSRVVFLYKQITTLQPRVTLFWEMAAAHMAFDASAAALQNPNQPREALRIKASREYIQIGREFLEEGVRNNPDRSVLYNRLGFLLMEKAKDHYGAYQAYTKASQFPEAFGYEKRLAAYELSYCPGKETEAYALLLKLYHKGKEEHTFRLLQRIKAMEEKLNISPEQRVCKPTGNPS